MLRFGLKTTVALALLASASTAMAEMPKVGTAAPMNFVIDKAGVIRYAEAGSFTLESLEQLVLPLLKEPGPDAASRL
jgi:peroxiredoxin